MDDDDDIVPCPVCESFTFEENLASQGLVVGAVKAILEGDTSTIELIYDSLSAFDAHTAISLLAELLLDTSIAVASDPMNWVASMREGINRALTES